MNYQITRIKHLNNWVFFTALFIIFVIFFSFIHPIAPYDTDDWQFMYYARPGYPSIHQWNPTKILPEFLQPFMAMVAGYVITPIVGDYISAQVYANAIAVSFFIVLYLYSVKSVLSHKFAIEGMTSYIIILFYVLLHFVILRVAEIDNEYLWYSLDSTCYYHYVISGLLCASYTFWLISHDNKIPKDNVSRGVLIFVTYLAFFSNLYFSVIIIAYAGSCLVFDLFDSIKNKKEDWLKNYIKKNAFFLFLIILWGVVMLIELQGRRAYYSEYIHTPFLSTLLFTIKTFFTIRLNVLFLIITLGLILAAKLYSYFKEKKSLFYIGRQQLIICFALILLITYILLLSSRVDPSYASRSDVVFSYAFFYFYLVLLAIGYLCSKTKWGKIIVPFLVFIMLFNCNTIGNTYKDVQYNFGLNGQMCMERDRDHIRQVCEAEAMGQDTVRIKVPFYNHKDYNWPLMLPFSYYLGDCLYKHNVTKRRIVTLYQPTESIK